MTDCDVLIVGAGPAGLAAAVALREASVARVTVLDREVEPGGVPRHCDHTGFGWFDLRRLLRGPAYARRRVALARDAGAEILAATTAIGWDGPTTLSVTSPGGVQSIAARAVLLATGCRERPRAARLVPGTRPAGVLTTGSLQQLVHLRHVRPGRRAVVVGAEHVSFSAVMTLAAAGAEVAAMVTELPRHQTVPGVAWLLATRHRFPIHTGTRVTGIGGQRRVEWVTVADVGTGEERRIACDTIVFTGDWIPEQELARTGGLIIDPCTRGPAVDQALRTSSPGVFAAGNLLHGAEMADLAALEGRATARAIVDWLRAPSWPTGIPVTVAPPLRWIAPNRVIPGTSPPLGRFVLRTDEFLPRGRLEVRQGDRLLHSQRTGPLTPNRAIHLSASWTEIVTPGENLRVVRA